MTTETEFVAAVSQARDPDVVWTALDRFAAGKIGHRLFTVSIVDVPGAVVRRAYSNMPRDYPTSGTKPLRGNTGDWFETVFNRRRMFVANTIADIAKVFPDHELIGSLGCGSVINLPIVLGGELVATINLLDVAGRYTPETAAAAEHDLAIPARLCSALAAQFDKQRGRAA